jgi:hypothetical protein
LVSKTCVALFVAATVDPKEPATRFSYGKLKSTEPE